MSQLNIRALKSRLVRDGDSIVELLSEALSRSNARLRTGDIIAISSKVVAISEGRIRGLVRVRPTLRAKNLARKYSIPTAFAQIVLEEADRVLGGVRGALLTIKNGDSTANAGVDRKNAPQQSVVLWPLNSDASAEDIRESIQSRLGKKVGVVIVDSRVTPLRLGTVGLAIGCAGFQAVRDLRGTRDLSGRRIEITRHAIADGIAAAAHLVMGEADERTPFVVVRGAPASFQGRSGIGSAKLAQNHCLYMSQIIRTTPAN
jgi:coenzyme F420-0:L-glutamate ligase